MREFADRLYNLRKKKGLTLDELGAALNIQKSTLWRYEKNETDPSLENAKKIAHYFNVSMDYISGITDNKSISNGISKEELLNKLKELL